MKARKVMRMADRGRREALVLFALLTTAVLVFVLAAIAVRQIWMRRFSPVVGE